MYARVYQEKAKATKAAAEKTGPGGKKVPMDPAIVKLFNAQNDSLLTFFKKFQDAPVKVTFNLFAHDGGKHTLGGTVENLSAETKSYDVKFEFLDATGKVIATSTAKLDAVAPKTSKPFRVTADGEGVVAFRYAPIA